MIKTIYEIIKKILNLLTKNGRYKNFVSNLEKMWREAYYSSINSNQGTKYSKNVDNFTDLGYNTDGTPVQPGDLVNEFKNYLTGPEWYKYNQNITKKIKNKGNNFETIDIVNNKIIYTEVVNGKEQVYDVQIVKDDKSAEEYLKFAEEVYDENNTREIQDFIQNMFEEELLSRYNESNYNSDETIGLSRKIDGQNNRRSRLQNRRASINNGTTNIQENIKELENSSFFLKKKQNSIIQKANPMLDEYHTGIRSTEDIKIWEEVLQLDDEVEGQFAWGDFDREQAEQALKNKSITIYSSKPIKNGVFVSTSYIQSEQYAGGRGSKIYEKTVPLNEVAWINCDEGQYAKVNIETNTSTQTKGNIPINPNLMNKYKNVKEIFENASINYNNIVKINSLNIETKGKKASEIYHLATEIFNKNHPQKVFINNGNEIRVNNQDIKESVNKIFNNQQQNKYLKQHLEVFSDLGDIIEKSTLVNQTSENKNREKYNSWNYYYGGLEIDNSLYNLEFDVVSKNDGENHYRLQRIEKANIRSTLPINGEADLRISASSDNNIPQSENKVKSDIILPRIKLLCYN